MTHTEFTILGPVYVLTVDAAAAGTDTTLCVDVAHTGAVEDLNALALVPGTRVCVTDEVSVFEACTLKDCGR